ARRWTLSRQGKIWLMRWGDVGGRQGARPPTSRARSGTRGRSGTRRDSEIADGIAVRPLIDEVAVGAVAVDGVAVLDAAGDVVERRAELVGKDAPAATRAEIGAFAEGDDAAALELHVVGFAVARPPRDRVAGYGIGDVVAVETHRRHRDDRRC